MKGNSVCFISAKGGSGKTVICSSLGTFLAELGFRVLLVDTDAATNGMTLLYLDQLLGSRRERFSAGTGGAGLFDANENKKISIVKINENLHFVPATFKMAETEKTDLTYFEISLKNLLNGAQEYDFVLMDAQAGTDSFAYIAAEIAEQCVIVSEYDPVSSQGVERLKVQFGKVLDPTATWTLFNKVLPEFVTAIGEGLSVARYLPPIPWDADVVRAFARRDLAIDMKAPNLFTLAMAQVALNILPDETGEAIEKWNALFVKETTEPVEERLREVRHVIKVLEEKRLWRRKSMAAFSIFAVSVYTISVMGFSGIWSDILGGDSFWLTLNKYNRLLAALLGGTVAVSLMILTYRDNFIAEAVFRRNKINYMSLDLVKEEERALEAQLGAAKALANLNARAGYYERQRRRKSPSD
jgi:cellulose biosynthesis protein BcsQ